MMPERGGVLVLFLDGTPPTKDRQTAQELEAETRSKVEDAVRIRSESTPSFYRLFAVVE